MAELHQTASRGYSTAAQSYVQGRPDYPPETNLWLREVVTLGPGKTVVELGAGTGKFIPFLQATNARVIAVEPVPAMRAALTDKFPDVEALEGVAEAIPLPDAAVDAIVCAQAFHWFATKAALAEMRRVLKPGGVLGLIWNLRGAHEPWVAALDEIIDPFEAGTPRFKTGDWRKPFPADGFAELEERRAVNAHVGTPDQVIMQRTLSTSFIATLPKDQLDGVRREVEQLITSRPELAGQAQVSMPYDTRMFAFRKVA